MSAPEAYGILVPTPGIEPGLPAVRELSPSHWTTRDVPREIVYNSVSFIHFMTRARKASALN